MSAGTTLGTRKVRKAPRGRMRTSVASASGTESIAASLRRCRRRGSYDLLEASVDHHLKSAVASGMVSGCAPRSAKTSSSEMSRMRSRSRRTARKRGAPSAMRAGTTGIALTKPASCGEGRRSLCAAVGPMLEMRVTDVLGLDWKKVASLSAPTISCGVDLEKVKNLRDASESAWTRRETRARDDTPDEVQRPLFELLPCLVVDLALVPLERALPQPPDLFHLLLVHGARQEPSRP